MYPFLFLQSPPLPFRLPFILFFLLPSPLLPSLLFPFLSFPLFPSSLPLPFICSVSVFSFILPSTSSCVLAFLFPPFPFPTLSYFTHTVPFTFWKGRVDMACCRICSGLAMFKSNSHRPTLLVRSRRVGRCESAIRGSRPCYFTSPLPMTAVEASSLSVPNDSWTVSISTNIAYSI